VLAGRAHRALMLMTTHTTSQTRRRSAAERYDQQHRQRHVGRYAAVKEQLIDSVIIAK